MLDYSRLSPSELAKHKAAIEAACEARIADANAVLRVFTVPTTASKGGKPNGHVPIEQKRRVRVLRRGDVRQATAEALRELPGERLIVLLKRVRKQFPAARGNAVGSSLTALVKQGKARREGTRCNYKYFPVSAS